MGNCARAWRRSSVYALLVSTDTLISTQLDEMQSEVTQDRNKTARLLDRARKRLGAIERAAQEAARRPAVEHRAPFASDELAVLDLLRMRDSVQRDIARKSKQLGDYNDTLDMIERQHDQSLSSEKLNEIATRIRNIQAMKGGTKEAVRSMEHTQGTLQEIRTDQEMRDEAKEGVSVELAKTARLSDEDPALEQRSHELEMRNMFRSALEHEDDLAMLALPSPSAAIAAPDVRSVELVSILGR